MFEVDLERGVLIPTRGRFLSERKAAPAELAVRFLDCRARVRHYLNPTPVRTAEPGGQVFGRLDPLASSFVIGVATAACQEVYKRSVNYGESTRSNTYDDLIVVTSRETPQSELSHLTWLVDPQAHYSRIDDEVVRSTNDVAARLLSKLRHSLDAKDVTRAFRSVDRSSLEIAANLLVQLGAASAQGNALRVTNEGLKLLQMNSAKDSPQRSHSGTVSWRKKLLLSGLFASFAAAAVASKAALKRAASAVSSRNGESGKDNRNAQNSLKSDPNYQAYLREYRQLRQKHGRCVVAYADGRLVAIGRDMADLEDKIPSEYWKKRLLIRNIPEQRIVVRPRIRVTS